MAVVGYKKVSAIAQVSVASRLQAEIKERFGAEFPLEICTLAVKEVYDRSQPILVSTKEQLFDLSLRLILEWDEQGKFDDGFDVEVEASFEPTEDDLEDAGHFIDAFGFQGSPKQIDWARNIAHKNNVEVAIALRANKTIPPSAKWWIENRSNIEIR